MRFLDIPSRCFHSIAPFVTYVFFSSVRTSHATQSSPGSVFAKVESHGYKRLACPMGSSEPLGNFMFAPLLTQSLNGFAVITPGSLTYVYASLSCTNLFGCAGGRGRAGAFDAVCGGG